MTREEAITALGDRNNLLWGMSKEEQKYYSEAIDMAISALSENKGEWISVATGNAIQLKDGYTTESVKCSVCDEWLTASDEYACCGSFCPNCGAKMKGGE